MLTVNGVAVASPSVLKAEWKRVGASVERAASGAAVADFSGGKWKISLEWAYMTASERAALLTAVRGGFFTATLPDPAGSGTLSSSFYITSADMGLECVRGGSAMWMNVRMTWEEA